jgi:hypothetical protein
MLQLKVPDLAEICDRDFVRLQVGGSVSKRKQNRDVRHAIADLPRLTAELFEPMNSAFQGAFI